MAAARFGFLHSRSDHSIGWRLLTTNNRDLGRASSGFPDRESCRAAASWLKHNVAELRVTLVRSGATSWRWRMLAGDIVVAVASRDYQRRIQAEQAAAVVLQLIPNADLVGMCRFDSNGNNPC